MKKKLANITTILTSTYSLPHTFLSTLLLSVKFAVLNQWISTWAVKCRSASSVMTKFRLARHFFRLKNIFREGDLKVSCKIHTGVNKVSILFTPVSIPRETSCCELSALMFIRTNKASRRAQKA